MTGEWRYPVWSGATPAGEILMESSTDVEREDGPSLLVVDDNEPIRKLLAKALQPEGFVRVETAATADEARKQLQQHVFDIVITDISMPDGDGIELMQWANDHFPGASWMVLTGHATVDAAVRALQLGAFDFITKPFRNEEILPLISRIEDQSAESAQGGSSVAVISFSFSQSPIRSCRRSER